MVKDEAYKTKKSRAPLRWTRLLRQKGSMVLDQSSPVAILTIGRHLAGCRKVAIVLELYSSHEASCVVYGCIYDGALSCKY